MSWQEEQARSRDILCLNVPCVPMRSSARDVCSASFVLLCMPVVLASPFAQTNEQEALAAIFGDE